jgi:hypothetical protein
MPYRYHYDPNQPRVSAGQHDGGKWTRDGTTRDATLKLGLGLRAPPEAPQTARMPIAAPGLWLRIAPELTELALRAGPVARLLMALPAGPVLSVALELFRALSERNSRDQRAVIGFNSREYGAGGKAEIDLETFRLLDREETKRACPKIDEVQKMTDNAAEDVRRTESELEGALYGTAVHSCLKRNIDASPKLGLKAEVSYLKDADVTYGRKGSIRIDVLEQPKEGHRMRL